MESNWENKMAKQTVQALQKIPSNQWGDASSCMKTKMCSISNSNLTLSYCKSDNTKCLLLRSPRHFKLLTQMQKKFHCAFPFKSLIFWTYQSIGVSVDGLKFCDSKILIAISISKRRVAKPTFWETNRSGILRTKIVLTWNLSKKSICPVSPLPLL
jgi:hypothetical protein